MKAFARQSEQDHRDAASSTTRRYDSRRAARSALRCLLSCAVLAGLLSPFAIAQEEINREHTLKALFLYNFGSYIEWPAAAFSSPQSPFVIGILGSTPVEATLREIAATKRIGGRPIQIEHFSSAAEVTPCQTLFIAREVGEREQQAAVDRLARLPVLLVGESTGFAHRGGVVNFFIEANKIRFEINIDVARQRALKISAKLLTLARVIGETSAARR